MRLQCVTAAVALTLAIVLSSIKPCHSSGWWFIRLPKITIHRNVKHIVNTLHHHQERGTTHKGKLPNIRDVMKNAAKGKFVHCNLATSYGTLTKQSLKTMDANLTVIMGHTLLKMAALKDPVWKDIKKAMGDNKMLELVPHSEKEVERYKDYDNTKWFNVKGTRDMNIARDVVGWYRNQIGNSDVLRDTSVDVAAMATLMSETGAHVSSAGALFSKKVSRTKDMMDIGVLRLPDITRPQFDIYTIGLSGNLLIIRALFMEQKYTSMSLYYNYLSYRPVHGYLKGISEAARKIALKEIESLFD